MHLDAPESTHQARTALEGILQWGKEELGLNYSDTSISRWAYVSDITFETDFPLLSGINGTLNSIARKVSDIVQGNLGEDLEYEPAKIVLAHDPSRRSSSIAPFSIEHRAISLFEENIYYSEAPIPTDEHISLISELEEAARENFESQQRTIRRVIAAHAPAKA
jgi:hypothetical protein